MNLHDLQAGLGWAATLELAYESEDGATRIGRRRHSGPLAVQKPFYPEGRELCHSVILHPPGGIAGGDSLSVDVTVGSGARVLLTTPGATKWYRSAGPVARQHTRLRVGSFGSVEWLPQENIIFESARAEISTSVELQDDARYIGWDITRLGRTASGERFDAGRLYSRTEVQQAGRRLWGDYAQIEGGAALLRSPAGLAGHPVMGTLLVVGLPDARELLDACRAVPIRGAGRCGVTALSGLWVARYLGVSAEAARQYFVALWRLVRPTLLGREISVPRIWST